MCVISEASEYKHITFPTIVGDALAVSSGMGTVVIILPLYPSYDVNLLMKDG